VTSFEDSDQAAVLGSASTRAKAIDELVSLVDAYDADGVNVDFEGLDVELKSEFVTFIQELAAEVDEVFIATPAVDWNGSYDYDELAAASDGLFIMGYDYHWSGSDPGPGDPLYGGDPWGAYSLEWTVDDYLTWDTPVEKIILGLPLYGRWWPTTSDEVPGTATSSGTAYSYAGAWDYAPEGSTGFDDVTRTPYSIVDDGQLWYGDVDSVEERIEWALDQGVQGVGFWAIGYTDGDAEFWNMVSERTGSSSDTGDPGSPDSGGADSGEVDSGSTGNGEPPVADAGESFMAYRGEAVTLDGSESYDPDGDAVQYQWTQVGGETVEIALDTTAAPRFTPEEAGTVSIELVVTDGSQFSDPDTVDVVVVDGPSEGKGGIGCGCTSVSTRARGAGWGWLGIAMLGLGLRRRGG
jgi:hypothetical protein